MCTVYKVAKDTEGKEMGKITKLLLRDIDRNLNEKYVHGLKNSIMERYNILPNGL